MGRVELPAHVGIIMDGNGRWAKKKGLPRIAGHGQGAKVFGDIARHAAKRGIKYLTVYAFSTENWQRPRDEVDGIMNLMRDFLNDAGKYRSENIRVIVIGDRLALDIDIREKIERLESDSAGMTGMTLVIALNYGGRDELLRAAKTLARRYAAGEVKNLDEIDEKTYTQYLYTENIPDVDLIIRTSGEMRVSNFMLWQGAYAEYVFPETLWPDFKAKHFDRALEEYCRRDRRHGGV